MIEDNLERWQEIAVNNIDLKNEAETEVRALRKLCSQLYLALRAIRPVFVDEDDSALVFRLSDLEAADQALEAFEKMETDK